MNRSYGNKLTISLFIFICGISAGAFFVTAMSVSEKNTVIASLKNYFLLRGNSGADVSYPYPFFPSLGENSFLLAVILLCSFRFFLIPVAYSVLIYKGISLGFAAGLMIESMGFKSLSVIFISVLPQNLFIIPAFILACAYAHKTASLNKKRGINTLKATGTTAKPALSSAKKSSDKYRSSFISNSLVFFAVILIGCIVEALIYALMY